MGDVQRPMARELVVLVRAEGHRDACAAGVGGELEIVRRVTDHQGAVGRRAELAHQLDKHQRVGLAARLVGRAGGVEQARQGRAGERLIEAAARLAGSDCEPVVARLQREQHLQRAVEEDDLVLAREVVMTIAIGELAVALAREVGRRVAQGIAEAEADDEARVAVARHGRADIGARRLDATRDQARRIEEGAVPVEDDQVEAAR